MSQGKASSENLQAMLKKAERKLVVAKKDLESGFFDDASSRSYYAAYHAAVAVLAERGLSFSSHGQTLGAFNREFVKTGLFPPDTSQILQRLFQNRQVGDYEWGIEVDQATAEKDLAVAESFVRACREHLKKILGTSWNDK